MLCRPCAKLAGIDPCLYVPRLSVDLDHVCKKRWSSGLETIVDKMSNALTKQEVEVGGLPADVHDVKACCKVLQEMPSYIMRPRPYTCRICLLSWDFFYADDGGVLWRATGSTGPGAGR